MQVQMTNRTVLNPYKAKRLATVQSGSRRAARDQPWREARDPSTISHKPSNEEVGAMEVAAMKDEEAGWQYSRIISLPRQHLFPRRFVAKSQSRVARPTRGGAQDRGVLEKYVEGLSDEPVGLATLGCGRACRSSGSAIAAEPSGAFKASDLRKHNRSERKSQTQN